MIRYLIPFLWLALVVDWLISALRIKPAKQIEGRAPRLMRMALTVSVFAFLFSPRAWVGWLGERFVPPSDAIAIVGTAVTALGVGLAAWARYSLGQNWSAAVTLKEAHELVRAGPYARIRHPIYSGVILGLLGTALALGEWRAIVAVAVLFVSYFIKARKEEAFLAFEFGRAFQDYCSRTGMFLPRLG
jgi:protein-S-isoprenylcysteine O-methyltransferase Ste14